MSLVSEENVACTQGPSHVRGIEVSENSLDFMIHIEKFICNCCSKCSFIAFKDFLNLSNYTFDNN